MTTKREWIPKVSKIYPHKLTMNGRYERLWYKMLKKTNKKKHSKLGYKPDG